MKKTLILAGAAVLLLSACGRMADLEPPQGATAPDAPRRQTERAPRDRNAPALPEPGTINRPPSQLPIDNGGSNPYGRPPQI